MNSTPLVRLLGILSITLLITLLVLLVPTTVPQNNLAWDFFMGVGYLSLGFMLLAPVASTRFWFTLGGRAAQVRGILSAHRLMSYLVLVLLLSHIVGLIIIDRTVIEYLKPSAPWGMLSAIVSSLAIVLLMAQSEFRIKLNMRYKNWSRWHGWLSVIMIGGAFYHIYEARYYVPSVGGLIALSALCLSGGIFIFIVEHKYAPREEVSTEVTAGMVKLTLYASIVALGVVFIFAIPDAGNRDERQIMQCLISNC